MVRLGVFLIVMGIGSLIMPLLGRQFYLMMLFDGVQPAAGIIIAVLGALLAFIGARNNRKTEMVQQLQSINDARDRQR